MEQWSFPPQYGDTCCPAALSRDGFPRRETMRLARREATMDKQLRQVEPMVTQWEEGAGPKSAFRDAAGRRIPTRLGLRVTVNVVTPNNIPCADFKARRIIDDGTVFPDTLMQPATGAP